MTEAAWKALPQPKANSRWDAPGIGRTVRVMGVVEGYVMCRRSGTMPYIVHMSDWHKVYVEKQMTPRRGPSRPSKNGKTP